MSDWLYLLFIPIIFIIFWRWPNKSKRGLSERSVTSPSRTPPSPFHAISIKPGDKSCYQVSQLEGKRFLASEAMPLPVGGCDAKQCHCTYKHHQDRRQGERRHASIKIDNVHAKAEHRVKSDRRRSNAFS